MAVTKVERPWSERRFELALRRTRLVEGSKAMRGAKLHLTGGYSVNRAAVLVGSTFQTVGRAVAKLREIDKIIR